MSAGTAEGRWRDLSGSEVRDRLVQRGMAPEFAALLYRAHLRGDVSAASAIDKALAR